MPLTVTLEISDAELDYFRSVMSRVREHAGHARRTRWPWQRQAKWRACVRVHARRSWPVASTASAS